MIGMKCEWVRVEMKGLIYICTLSAGVISKFDFTLPKAHYSHSVVPEHRNNV